MINRPRSQMSKETVCLLWRKWQNSACVSVSAQTCRHLENGLLPFIYFKAAFCRWSDFEVRWQEFSMHTSSAYRTRLYNCSSRIDWVYHIQNAMKMFKSTLRSGRDVFTSTLNSSHHREWTVFSVILLLSTSSQRSLTWRIVGWTACIIKFLKNHKKTKRQMCFKEIFLSSFLF